VVHTGPARNEQPSSSVSIGAFVTGTHATTALPVSANFAR
jgi:hypothetical protein